MKVLDHGYVEIIETYGSDERIIEAARMSTGKGFQGWDKDAKLLKYLWEHKHLTPFEMAGAIFEIKAPIFVFREWHRHRTQSYNEMSARYIPIPNEHYVPLLSRVEPKDTNNKQAASATPYNATAAKIWIDWLDVEYQRANLYYQNGLDAGVPKEIARLIMPVGRYSKMRANANLRNWLAFLTLRMDENAQWEIRQYAQSVHSFLQERFPRTLALFDGAAE